MRFRISALVPWCGWSLIAVAQLVAQDQVYGSGTSLLGVNVEPVSAALASQLDLPKGQGQLVGLVTPGSAADKAGLHTHDILLQLNGQPVSRDPAQFTRFLAGIPPKTAVDAVVLRKGKKVDVKGIALPETSAVPVPPAPLYSSPSRPASGTSNTVYFLERSGKSWDAPVDSQVFITTFRQQDRFTTRYQEGSLIVTVIGKLTKGQAAVGQVKVQDGGVEHRYPTLDKVPPEYQDKVRDLLVVSEKGQGQIEIKKP